LNGAGLRGLAEEQAALRRVATLVAQGTPQEEVFAAVIEEVVRLLGADLATTGRYESDGTLTSVARSGGPPDQLPVGSRRKLGGKNLGTIVFETGRPARIDGYADTSSGSLGGAVQQAGIRSSVATPITGEGRLWGVIAAGSTEQEPMPPETEARLADFTELVATAIANAERRAELRRLAGQQTALQTVATLAAAGTPPEEVFAAVIDEVMQLFAVDYAGMARYDPNDMTTAVGARGTTHFPVGSSRPLAGGTPIAVQPLPPDTEAGADEAPAPRGSQAVAPEQVFADTRSSRQYLTRATERSSLGGVFPWQLPDLAALGRILVRGLAYFATAGRVLGRRRAELAPLCRVARWV
jgi:hypothetical protein